MAVNLSPAGGVAAQFFTNTGAVLTGGKLYTYAAGTTTPAATYTSSSGGTAQPNPIVLDAAGRVPGGEIWLTNTVPYKFTLKDSNDVLIATYDNIFGINDTTASNAQLVAFEATLAGSTGSSLVGYLPDGSDAVATTVQSKLREWVSVNDFGAVGDYNATTNTGTDCTVAFQNALDYINNMVVVDAYSLKGELYLPEGKYLVSSTLSVYGHTTITGPGTIIYSGSGVCLDLSPSGISQVQIHINQIGLMCTSATATVAIYSLNNLRQTIQAVVIAGDPRTEYGDARWTTAAIQLDSSSGLNTFQINIWDCVIERIAGDSILMTGEGGQNSVHIMGCSIEASDGYGIRGISASNGAGCGHLTVDGCTLEGFYDSPAIWLPVVVEARITNNHFEYAAPPAFPMIKFGGGGFPGDIANAVLLSQNSFSGTSTGAVIEIKNFINSTIENNIFGVAQTYVINVTNNMANCRVANNSLVGNTEVFSTTSYDYINSIDLQTNEKLTYRANPLYSSFVQKSNAAFSGVQSVKPGDVGSNYYYNAYSGTDFGLFAVGDAIFNSAPTLGGYAGWICTYAGYAHVYLTGTLTSGSNQITGVSGGLFDWAIGAKICTNTDALGVPAGTTITNISGTTITISTNATASGSVSLYGARFNSFGLIAA